MPIIERVLIHAGRNLQQEMDIYQEIWDADLKSGAGIKAYLPEAQLSQAQKNAGYIIVDKQPSPNAGAEAHKGHMLFKEVHIPASKQASYDTVAKLFDNYILDQTKIDPILMEESEEIQDFLTKAVDSASHQVAMEYLRKQFGHSLNKDQWYAMVERHWFERFDSGQNKDLSGFEHVFAGEQKQGKVQGYHFWFKYMLDEEFQVPGEFGNPRDLINVLGFHQSDDPETPEVATLKFEWEAFDYQAKKFRKLTKPIGGFWIGLSAEAQLAIGTIAALPQAQAPKKTVINGFKYNLKLFFGPGDRNIRTFYPEFAGKA